MDLKKNNLRNKVKELCFRAIRLVGVFIVIYISMVFYLALTERQRTFPRAITHKEANASIQGKAKEISCTLEDGVVLNGWKLGNENAPIWLYFPDAEEDAAQFLAEVEEINDILLVTFNYRGSGENKGKPSEETFESDGAQITECATQITGDIPSSFLGRGTGAIIAAEQALTYKRENILIDPIFSIADAVSQKYRKLYPKFLVRTNVAISQDKLAHIQDKTTIIIDRKQFEHRTLEQKRIIPKASIIYREGKPLREVLKSTLK